MNDILITGGTIALTLIAAYLYSYLTDSTAGVDVDNDGADEVTFNGDEPTVIADAGMSEDIEVPSTTEIAEYTAQLYDLTSVTDIGDTRAEAFKDAGFETVVDLYEANDDELQAVYGIGEQAVAQIREDIGSHESDDE